MAPSRNPRNYKRVPQACSNCRRKKTRCPGEKPACSHCVRLRQNCEYPDSQLNGVHANHSSNSRLEDRLAQLEERVDLAFERPRRGSNRRQNETPESTAPSDFSPTINIQTSSSGLLPPEHVVARAIDTYYNYSHRQPLWLFNHDDTLSPSSCEELLLTILSIAAQHPSYQPIQESMLSPETYSDAARSLIMLRIASASVDLSILQALCLLAYSNFLLNDMSLASFHCTLAKMLLQSSGLESQRSQQISPKLEEQRRLIWSIFLLDYICGQQQKTPFLIEDIHNPRYLKMEGIHQRISDPCASLPHESYNDEEEESIGIWGHMVNMVSLWTEMRFYVSRCAEGDSNSPWKPDSTYTLINSHILDMERVFPDFYRYDSANFSERSVEEITTKREHWLPWLRVQTQYHLFHCLLNHPFLLSSSKPRTITGTNAFWKTASQLALLHSTWISRLLEMAKDRNLQLSDPYFTYAAVVAATLHTYWSRAADATVRSSARKYLEICQKFVTETGPQWPVCQSLASLLNDFLHIMLRSQPVQRNIQESDEAKASLMWTILEFGVTRPNPRERGLFRPSFFEDMDLHPRTRQGDFTLDEPDLDSTPSDIHSTVGHHAAPPDRFSVATASRFDEQDVAQEREQLPDDQPPPQEPSILDNDASSFPSLLNWAWTPDNTQGFYNANIRFQEQGEVNLDWWDSGIL